MPGVRVRLRVRASLRVGLLWAMWLLTGVYVVALALHSLGWAPALGGGFNTAVNGWLAELSLWVPTAVCWLAVSRVGTRRPEVLLSAAAVTSFTLGDTYYTVMTVGSGSLPYPWLADVGYLCFYPLMLAALVVAVRGHLRGLASAIWLDGAVGSLGATSVLAVLLSPVLASATVGSGPLARAVAVAYPLFDLLLVAAVAGIAALGDGRMGSRWALPAAGLLVFAAADVVYGLQVTAGTYVLGTPLDAGWTIGLVVMATWVDCAAGREGPPSQAMRPATGAKAPGGFIGGHRRGVGGASRGNQATGVGSGCDLGRGDPAGSGSPLPAGFSPSGADGGPSPAGRSHRRPDRVTEPTGSVCGGAGSPG